MNIKSTAVICITVTAGAYASSSLANNGNTGGQPMPQFSNNSNWNNPYWQAPGWPQPRQNNAQPNQPPVNQAPVQRPPAPPSQRQPVYNNYNQAPPQNYRPLRQYNNQGYTAPPQYTNRGNPMPPPPQGPYTGSYYGPDNGASAFHTPGYRNNYRGNRWSNNKFWGSSGPSKWMNPSKKNLEQGWDDMMNAPSRMGEMPGGWTAPEVTVPNPIDMGDQIQDNIKDLPEQIRNMDVGNSTEQ